MATNERALLALGLLALGASGGKPGSVLPSLNQKLRAAQTREPMKVTLATVLAGAAAFYAAERGKNPKVNSFSDALVFVSTSLSVGYSDIFARTPVGKALASALMTWGPALAARAFDPPIANPDGAHPASESGLKEISAQLAAILNELKAQRA